MQRHIRKLQKDFFTTNKGHHALSKYAQMMEHEGWKIHQDCLIYLKGLILDDLLGSRFTELKPIEKDVRQRAYAGVNEIIDFLLNPVAQARNANAIRQHNMKMEATVRGATKGEKT